MSFDDQKAFAYDISTLLGGTAMFIYAAGKADGLRKADNEARSRP